MKFTITILFLIAQFWCCSAGRIGQWCVRDIKCSRFTLNSICLKDTLTNKSTCECKQGYIRKNDFSRSRSVLETARIVCAKDPEVEIYEQAHRAESSKVHEIVVKLKNHQDTLHNDFDQMKQSINATCPFCSKNESNFDRVLPSAHPLHNASNDFKSVIAQDATDTGHLNEFINSNFGGRTDEGNASAIDPLPIPTPTHVSHESQLVTTSQPPIITTTTAGEQKQSGEEDNGVSGTAGPTEKPQQTYEDEFFNERIHLDLDFGQNSFFDEWSKVTGIITGQQEGSGVRSNVRRRRFVNLSGFSTTGQFLSASAPKTLQSADSTSSHSEFEDNPIGVSPDTIEIKSHKDNAITASPSSLTIQHERNDTKAWRDVGDPVVIHYGGDDESGNEHYKANENFSPSTAKPSSITTQDGDLDIPFWRQVGEPVVIKYGDDDQYQAQDGSMTNKSDSNSDEVATPSWRNVGDPVVIQYGTDDEHEPTTQAALLNRAGSFNTQQNQTMRADPAPPSTTSAAMDEIRQDDSFDGVFEIQNSEEDQHEDAKEDSGHSTTPPSPRSVTAPVASESGSTADTEEKWKDEDILDPFQNGSSNISRNSSMTTGSTASTATTLEDGTVEQSSAFNDVTVIRYGDNDQYEAASNETSRNHSTSDPTRQSNTPPLDFVEIDPQPHLEPDESKDAGNADQHLLLCNDTEHKPAATTVSSPLPSIPLVNETESPSGEFSEVQIRTGEHETVPRQKNPSYPSATTPQTQSVTNPLDADVEDGPTNKQHDDHGNLAHNHTSLDHTKFADSSTTTSPKETTTTISMEDDLDEGTDHVVEIKYGDDDEYHAATTETHSYHAPPSSSIEPPFENDTAHGSGELHHATTTAYGEKDQYDSFVPGHSETSTSTTVKPETPTTKLSEVNDQDAVKMSGQETHEGDVREQVHQPVIASHSKNDSIWWVQPLVLALLFLVGEAFLLVGVYLKLRPKPQLLPPVYYANENDGFEWVPMDGEGPLRSTQFSIRRYTSAV